MQHPALDVAVELKTRAHDEGHGLQVGAETRRRSKGRVFYDTSEEAVKQRLAMTEESVRRTRENIKAVEDADAILHLRGFARH